jgi:hypothetical protein
MSGTKRSGMEQPTQNTLVSLCGKPPTCDLININSGALPGINSTPAPTALR